MKNKKILIIICTCMKFQTKILIRTSNELQMYQSTYYNDCEDGIAVNGSEGNKSKSGCVRGLAIGGPEVDRPFYTYAGVSLADPDDRARSRGYKLRLVICAQVFCATG